MSTSITIGTSKTDPVTLEWQGADSPNFTAIGGRTLSKFRSALLSFPPLTTAQYQAWKDICDDNQRHTLTSFPGICTSTYSTDPSAYDGVTLTPENAGITTAGLTFTGEYWLHFLGSRHSVGKDAVLIYDTQIEVYLVRLPQCPIPIELGGCS